MKGDLLNRLKSATGESCHVTATFVDVRGFSSFAGVADSTDTALYLRSLYTRLLDRFFPEADYFKLTGDGLMIIDHIGEEEDQVVTAIRSLLERALDLVEAFPTVTGDDLMVNFEVPQAVGVGIARGSATVLLDSAREPLDYSGRCLNLAARLMNLARPQGVVIADRHADRLLGEALQERFATSDVYVRGLGERPISIHYTRDWVKIPMSAIDAPSGNE
jgi:class 3 adenylate cyclase